METKCRAIEAFKILLSPLSFTDLFAHCYAAKRHSRQYLVTRETFIEKYRVLLYKTLRLAFSKGV